MVPGSNNVVRVNGMARLSVDEGLKRSFERKQKCPKTVIVIEVSEVYFQCAKALMRSELWMCASQEPLDVPTAGQFLKEARALSDSESYDNEYPEYAKSRMW